MSGCGTPADTHQPARHVHARGLRADVTHLPKRSKQQLTPNIERLPYAPFAALNNGYHLTCVLMSSKKQSSDAESRSAGYLEGLSSGASSSAAGAPSLPPRGGGHTLAGLSRFKRGALPRVSTPVTRFRHRNLWETITYFALKRMHKCECRPWVQPSVWPAGTLKVKVPCRGGGHSARQTLRGGNDGG